MNVVMRVLARRVFVLSLVVVTLFVVIASFASPSRAEQLVASWYGVGDGFAGLTTANGETFDPYAYTAAHKTLPFNTKLKVTYGGESVVVRINDRGPYITGRDVDLSYAAARDIGLVAAGSAPVEVEYLDPSAAVGPVQGNETPSAPAPEPAPEPAPAPEPEEGEGSQDQYGDSDQYSDSDQYADFDQYEDATEDQYEVPPPEPELEQPSPATVAPPVKDLQEPPEVLLKANTTVQHRVELKVAAASGTATDSPETPELAPVPDDDVVVSRETAEPAPERASAPQGAQITRLPDTGGPKLPQPSLVDLAAVLLVAVLLRSGLRRFRF